MTRLINDAQRFAGESLTGFASAHADRVRLVPDDGVTRAGGPGEGSSVAIVMGGGAGHYPAFLGWVGSGLAHGAVTGNIFSSPSASQVVRVADAAAEGRAVLFLPINYAGDILHFSEARDRLLAEGREARLVAIADDIASAAPDAAAQRRGIAGSFLVAKIVGAAVETGADIDEAERIARRAVSTTRSLGLAFSGCTLPGAAGPNFEVPDGQMALGLGIHGEPGLRMLKLESADQAADVLVDGLFEERAPVAGQRVAVLVNGLGATKYDELNVLFARIRTRIESVGMILVAPVVGELVTSLDMAGVSLSIGYLDDELEQLWTAPAHAVAFTRAQSAPTSAASTAARELRASVAGPAAVAPATPGSHALAARLVEALAEAAVELAERSEELARLDAVAGDGDHGACMQRGSGAAAEAAASAADHGAGAGSVLRAAGEAWSDVGGGTSGALWGAGLHAVGSVLGDDRDLDARLIRDAVDRFATTVAERGGAETGDKTMLDAIIPFATTFTRAVDAGTAPARAWHSAAQAARTGAERTADIVARRGRSRTHGDASLGTPDPGAVSFAMLVTRLDPGADAVNTHGALR